MYGEDGTAADWAQSAADNANRNIRLLEARVKELEDWAEKLEDKIKTIDTALYEHSRSFYPHPNYDPNPKYGSF